MRKEKNIFLYLSLMPFMLASLVLSINKTYASPPEPCRVKGAAQPMPKLRLRSVIKGLNDPVGIFNAGDGSKRLFIIEQVGMIRILKDGRILKKPFLDIRDRIASGGEMGLLGLAFHPHFKENKRFYVNYTYRGDGLHTVISEFRVGKDPDQALKNSEKIILTFQQPYSNHNGGSIVFGPDGFLYIGTGDGGAGNDPLNSGQRLSTLLGKMLRIDVDRTEKNKPYAVPRDNPFIKVKGAAPEVWAFGLRNPWRYSFDPVTGRLFAGDVGQNHREEIDVIEKARNYGWRIMEGNICTPGINPKCSRSGLEPPIIDYPRSLGISVIGGYVYRGASIPALCGAYLYADYGSGLVFALRYDGEKVTENKILVKTTRSITSFGEDEDRELYIVDHAGEILKIIPGKNFL